MQNTIIGILAGLWYGFISCFFLGIVACIAGIDDDGTLVVLVLCIGAIIGGGIGRFKDMEIKKEREIAAENANK